MLQRFTLFSFRKPAVVQATATTSTLLTSLRFNSNSQQQPSSTLLPFIRPAAVPCYDELDKINSAYRSYFDHVRFTKFGKKPVFDAAELAPYLRKAATVTWHIRHGLDSRLHASHPDAPPVLRQRDGNAQAFLHSDAAEAYWRSGDRTNDFLRKLVHFTLADAMPRADGGLHYVEGVTEAEVDAIFDAIVLGKPLMQQSQQAGVAQSRQRKMRGRRLPPHLQQQEQQTAKTEQPAAQTAATATPSKGGEMPSNEQLAAYWKVLRPYALAAVPALCWLYSCYDTTWTEGKTKALMTQLTSAA